MAGRPVTLTDRGVGREGARAAVVGHRVRALAVDLADPHRARGQRRREHDVVGRQEGDDFAGKALKLALGGEQLDRGVLVGSLPHRPGQRLDVLGGRVAAGQLGAHPRGQRDLRPEGAGEVAQQPARAPRAASISSTSWPRASSSAAASRAACSHDRIDAWRPRARAPAPGRRAGARGRRAASSA